MSDTAMMFLLKRQKRLADEMAQFQADVEHWNRTHPDEEPIVFSADLTADVKALRGEA